MLTEKEFIAHVRASRDNDLVTVERKQSLKEHLEGVAGLSLGFAHKIGLELAGELVGLIHDLGKYSQEFQNYLKSATGLLNPDEDEEFVDAKGLKGKVDHSTAGAQLVWKELYKQGQLGQVVGQILALCIASHHSGLIDCLTANSIEPVSDGFTRRMAKPGDKTHLEEVLSKADSVILDRFQSILKNENLIQSLKKALHRIINASPNFNNKDKSGLDDTVAQFQIGLLVRFLFSCLIDADRINTADFEQPKMALYRPLCRYAGWDKLIQKLEFHLSLYTPRYKIDKLRSEISEYCLVAARRKKGIYTLTVPTGGGKTLASLRFALNHAWTHGMDRVIYVIPFTSIIDQNADIIRKILDPESHPDDQGRIVLEHHSNLEPEMQGWKQKMLTETWDAPIIFTTNVQFLETLFGSGTRGARRLHQLANAIIVFDEIQTLPIRCVHLFNNSVNFLTEQCGSTVVLCTATQPLLTEVNQRKGAISKVPGSEIMPDVKGLFETLKRVDVRYHRRPLGWEEEEIASLALSEMNRAESCLVVVNTKKAAQGLFRRLDENKGFSLFHLSTSMCPSHRRRILEIVRCSLENRDSVLCISTQLIEAGVDIDFGAVIRFAAGLDSIAQAAGRCNRNGSRETGIVHVVNPIEENLENLHDIRIGRDKTNRVLDDFSKEPAQYNDNFIGPKAMEWYYQNYFFARQDEMDYPIESSLIGRDDTLLNLLSVNSQVRGMATDNYLRQSFMSAAKAFRAIEAPSRGVIVQYGKEGRDLVAELCASHEVEKQFSLLRRAQQYTVNVFPNEFKKLLEQRALIEIQYGTEIFYLNERYYSKNFGLYTEPVADEELLHV